jgi:hypothetical protein
MVMRYHVDLAAGHVSTAINGRTDDAPTTSHSNELANTEIGEVWTYETRQFVVDEDGDNAELGFENREDDLLDGDAEDNEDEDEQWVDDDEFLAMNDMYGL